MKAPFKQVVERGLIAPQQGGQGQQSFLLLPESTFFCLV